jgi:hypothetical protein
MTNKLSDRIADSLTMIAGVENLTSGSSYRHRESCASRSAGRR